MARKNQTGFRGAGYLLTAAFIYGFFGVLSRAVGLTIPIFYQNATRGIVATIILTFIVSAQRAWKPVSLRDFWILLIRQIAGSAAFLSFFYTIIKIPFGASYFLFYAGSTLFSYIFGHFWFSEHLTKLKIICLFLALSGLLLVYQVNTSIVSPFYFALAVFAGATTAVWDVISKKISGSYSASYISFWDDALSSIMYVALSLIAGEHMSMPTLTVPWMASLGIGVCFVATGMLMVNGFRYIEAQIGSIILLAEIPFAIFFAWLAYGETISLLTAVGGSLIVAAIILPEMYSHKS